MSYARREALARAQRRMQEERWGEALEILWSLADRTPSAEEDLQGLLRAMARAWSALGARRAVATVLWFLGDLEGARRAAEGEPRDLARLASAGGQRQDAARHYLDAGYLGHAALELEAAGDARGARVLWERLAEDARLAKDPYVGGLVRFNLARSCARVGDAAAARRAEVQAMHLLEAAADALEMRGLRERAFDCYQVLLTSGRDGAFENLAEGYVNCIRVLEEDNLRYYVLQYYDDFQRLSRERGELRAAATLYREAAAFCDRQALPHAAHYRLAAAETLVLDASLSVERGAPPELAESAYVAAVDTYAELGLLASARRIYEVLAGLPIDPRRRERYRGLVARLSAAVDAKVEDVPFPEYLRQDTAYPEIWRLDVLEWEQAGDAAETMAEVLLDPRWADVDYVRRPALLARLHVLGASEAERAGDAHGARLAQLLGRVEIYGALAPLEALYRGGSPEVRAACLRAVRQLFFKRSFELVGEALQDDDDAVRREAVAAVATLHFPHAFDPLARIHREHTTGRVRRAALESIGKIATADAVDHLVETLRHGPPDERAIARDLLLRNEHAGLDAMLERAAATEAGPARAALLDIRRLRAR